MSATTETVAETRQLVIFRLADEMYGVPITSVQEIIRHTPPRPMPDSPRGVEGVINLRGRLIPVLSLGERLGVATGDPEDAKVVIIELSDATVGIVVDEVREVATIDLAITEPPPANVVGGVGGAIESVAKLDDGLLVILDPERLLGRG
jgi:purine-binding chemotaxis protein CheW